MTSADKVFKMLSFQYKPIEKLAIEGLEKQGRADLVAKYKKFGSAQKIAYLDRVAGMMGL